MVICKKKEKKVKCNGGNKSEEGDSWVYTCVKRYTYFFVAFSEGKWTQNTCRNMFEKVYWRMNLPDPKNKIEIYMDGNDDYRYVLKDYYSNMNYGQLIKIKKNGKHVKKMRQIVYGAPELEDIETINVENFNGILRKE